MNPVPERPKLATSWMRVSSRFLPFADAATPELPLPRLLRLSLFQVSVGMAITLLIGTLNRVMIVELKVSALLVGLMVALPLLFAPFRALIGFRSDTHKSFLGWRRVPFIWFGSLLQFGGLAIMPFALLVMTGKGAGPAIIGEVGAALAFLLIGAGMHTTQTVGLALATDLAPVESQPRVVALMCTMLLFGMAASALVLGVLLADFSPLRLVQVIQGTAVVTMILNVIALWKQEARDPSRTAHELPTPSFRESWEAFSRTGHAVRRLVALGLGTVAFSMQDILLEPFGGEVLGLSVGSTTGLTAFMAFGGVAGFVLAARAIGRGVDAYRIAGFGAALGLGAFVTVIFAAPLQSIGLFALGVALIGFSSGLFAHATLTAAMNFAPRSQIGLALGIWGSVQATAAGSAIAVSGLIRDSVADLATAGALGPVVTGPGVGYTAVYAVELLLMFATLVAIGPLVRSAPTATELAAADALWNNVKSLNLREEIVQ
ncbi:PucC family protein [Nevskia sp.]|uniref:PucC family protein n=1 Tax=Nevskia sp. TaxID=1929292 RepID=UPI0025CEF3CC|nr:PucC family protein [Nevskia sp.]